MPVKKRKKPLPGDAPTPKGLSYVVTDLVVNSNEGSAVYPNLVRYKVLDEGLEVCESECEFKVATLEGVKAAINADIHHQKVRIALLRELKSDVHDVGRKPYGK